MALQRCRYVTILMANLAIIGIVSQHGIAATSDMSTIGEPIAPCNRRFSCPDGCPVACDGLFMQSCVYAQPRQSSSVFCMHCFAIFNTVRSTYACAMHTRLVRMQVHHSLSMYHAAARRTSQGISYGCDDHECLLLQWPQEQEVVTAAMQPLQQCRSSTGPAGGCYRTPVWPAAAAQASTSALAPPRSHLLLHALQHGCQTSVRSATHST